MGHIKYIHRTLVNQLNNLSVIINFQILFKLEMSYLFVKFYKPKWFCIISNILDKYLVANQFSFLLSFQMVAFNSFYFIGDGSAYFDTDLSRSPSPAPSSGVESNSFKESPMQIDMLSSDGTSIGEIIFFCF